MIYQYVKRYLKEKYSKPTMQQVWGNLDNLEFFSYLYKRYNDEEISRNISEIKEAFKDFFEPIGTILFRFTLEHGIKFKVLSYHIEPKNSKHLTNIISIINKNKRAILYPYKGQSDQIGITGAIRRKINLEINSTDESVNKKELTKYALKKALELGERDIVVQLQRMYLVKIFQTNKITKERKELPIHREGIQKRYNGYTKEEMQKSYANLFDTLKIEDFLLPIMKSVFTNKLNFFEITNSYYEENALKILQQEIAKELENHLSFEEDFILGLSGYIFRIHFYKVHEYIAIELLEQIYNKNANAEKFLMYYTGETILENSRKYIIPSLETKDGKKWNNSSILGLSSLWINAKTKIKKHQEELLDIEKKIKQAQKIYRASRVKTAEIKNLLHSAQEELLENKEQIRVIRASLTKKATYSSKELNIKAKLEISQKRVEELKTTIVDAKKEIYELEKSHTELSSLKSYHKKIKGEITAHDVNVDTNIARVNLILDSLTNALMSRKKLLR